MEKVEASKLERLLIGLVLHRMSLWLWLSVALAIAIFYFARHMLGVMLFKLALMTMAGYLGYWVARALERGHRPHELQERAQGALEDGSGERAWQLEQLAAQASMRRVLIVAACLVASAMGG